MSTIRRMSDLFLTFPRRMDTGTFSTTLPSRGNANTGHLYGVDLPPEQKEALVEYIKTL